MTMIQTTNHQMKLASEIEAVIQTTSTAAPAALKPAALKPAALKDETPKPTSQGDIACSFVGARKYLVFEDKLHDLLKNARTSY